MPDAIVLAASDSDYEAFAVLIREYWEWLRARYSAAPGSIDAIGNHQKLDDELRSLSTYYGPPRGKALLAVDDGQTTGCVAYRDLGDGACEMKRLFVPVRYQGRGTGRRLCMELITAAAADGYRLMRLDTGKHNTEAIAMYESIGFLPCPPYHDYPEPLMAHLRFMELSLVGDSAGEAS
jgi:ribosomal protein S18 acetylase RimI-like enzyme